MRFQIAMTFLCLGLTACPAKHSSNSPAPDEKVKADTLKADQLTAGVFIEDAAVTASYKAGEKGAVCGLSKAEYFRKATRDARYITLHHIERKGGTPLDYSERIDFKLSDSGNTWVADLGFFLPRADGNHEQVTTIENEWTVPARKMIRDHQVGTVPEDKNLQVVYDAFDLEHNVVTNTTIYGYFMLNDGTKLRASKNTYIKSGVISSYGYTGNETKDKRVEVGHGTATRVTIRTQDIAAPDLMQVECDSVDQSVIQSYVYSRWISQTDDGTVYSDDLSQLVQYRGPK